MGFFVSRSRMLRDFLANSVASTMGLTWVAGFGGAGLLMVSSKKREGSFVSCRPIASANETGFPPVESGRLTSGRVKSGRLPRVVGGRFVSTIKKILAARCKEVNFFS